MHIIHIATELAPVAKVGGLGDVLLGLSRELSWKKHDIDIIIPKYDCMDSNQVRDMTIFYDHLMSYFDGEWFSNTIWVGWVENLKVYFIEPHHPLYFFDRGCFYGCHDDIDRFLYFARTAIEFLFKAWIQPDILHLHDWQAAILAPLLKDMYHNLGYNKPKTVFTIHNLDYQGICSKNDLDRIGLKGLNLLVPDKLQDPKDEKLINLLKGGIVYSDFVTTVSPTYSKEVLTPENGKGLDRVLLQYKHKFCGVLNGVDYSFWNPELDRYLPAHFSAREAPAHKNDHNTLDKKGYLKHVLRDKAELADGHHPIVGCITRLVPQKGIQLIIHAMHRTLELGGQFVLLGHSPITSINEEFYRIKETLISNPNCHLRLNLEEEFAHWIYAGADMIIVPSLFEPCGLTQMIALRYGTIPIVRRTGGLADTVFDVDYSDKSAGEGNGYVFDSPDKASLDFALKRAFKCWYEHPERWRQLVIHAMNTDFSWNHPSNEYLEIYHKVLRS